MQEQYTLVYTPRDYRRMEQHLDKSGDCWLYVGQPSQAYPEFKNWFRDGERRKRVNAHVAAWEMNVGPIPDGMFVCHVCDHPRCCRTDDEGWHEVNGVLRRRCGHLFLGSAADNMHDMIAKGRESFPGAIVPNQGEAVGTHKLTDNDVRAIRATYAAGGVTQWDLAREYGVWQGIISAVIRRATWKHIE